MVHSSGLAEKGVEMESCGHLDEVVEESGNVKLNILCHSAVMRNPCKRKLVI